MLTLIDGDLSREVERISSKSSKKLLTFEDCYREVGSLLVPPDYSEDLDEELWNLIKRRNETVQRCLARLRELAQTHAELPQDAQTISQLQLCCYFRRVMPANWQDKLALCGTSHETITEVSQLQRVLRPQEAVRGAQVCRDRGNSPERKQVSNI